MATHQPHEGAKWHFNAPWRTRETPKAPSEVPWCSRVAIALTRGVGETGLHARFGKARCPNCGRRLQIMTVDIEQGHGDFWPYLPPHKIRKLKVPGVKARAPKRNKNQPRGR